MEPTTPLPQKSVFVWRRLEEVLRVFGREYDGHWWLLVLIPVLLLGLVYVVWMYVRDGRSVGWPWATFLGLLRCTVYCILAVMFLLPAEQFLEETTTRFKVILLFDVSGSMSNKDEAPTEAVPADKILSRQDKIVRFLSDDKIAFIKRLQRHPVTLYRFGGKLDTSFQLVEENDELGKEMWNSFLKPDPKQPVPPDLDDEQKAEFRNKLDLYVLLVNGTNVGDSLLEVLKREANNQPQGIVVFSDGRSTHFSTQTIDEIKKSKIPIFTVGIGEHRDPINIRITELLVPEQAQPDDKFPIKVDVDGEGKPDEEIEVFLDIFKPDNEKEIAFTMPQKVKFKRGEPPHAQAEFQIDPAVLPETLRNPAASAAKPELLEGKWKFVARVPKDKREIFEGKEHVSEPEVVNIVKKPLRVLLFAGAPTRDYQFARTLFVREVDAKRAELSIFLQLARPDIVQDVPNERMLRDFPNRIDDTKNPDEKAEEKYYNFLQYDVIIAFDPDWTKLQPEQIALLERWVSRHNGGLIVIGGPVNTFKLTKNDFLSVTKPVIDMLPVIPMDNRVPDLDRSTNDPWRLNFPGATTEMEYLKLDDESKEPLSGWEEFFTGRKLSEPGRDATLRRGFFDDYPLKDVKPNGTVVATFADPRARMKDGKERPFIVTTPYQGGKVVWIGSGEIWRLRQFRESFHERFWTKLCRFASSASQTGDKGRVKIYMSRTFSTNNIIRFEARLLGRDMRPLSPKETVKGKLAVVGGGNAPPRAINLEPKINLAEFDRLQTKEEQDKVWEGTFAGRFQVDIPGNYELEIQVPNTTDKDTKKFSVTESNPEFDNTKPDFAQLRQMASPVSLIHARLKEEMRTRLTLDPETHKLGPDAAEKKIVDAASEMPGLFLEQELTRTNAPLARENDKDLRLFFDLRSARLIPDLMTVKPLPQENRGPVKDLWDWGFEVGGEPPMKVSLALFVIVGLLSIEWLTRKLLKLA